MNANKGLVCGRSSRRNDSTVSAGAVFGRCRTSVNYGLPGLQMIEAEPQPKKTTVSAKNFLAKEQDSLWQ
jgi:hypothetical protein